MQWISQKEAEEFLKKPNTKIKVVYYVTKDCPNCDDFIPDIIEPLFEKYADHIEGYKVDSEDRDIMFPPTSFPTGFFHIPNTTEKMPLVRFGGAVPEYVEDDLLAMIEIKDQGKTIEQAFFVDRRPFLFPYGQTRPTPQNAVPAEASIKAFQKMKEAEAAAPAAPDVYVKSDWTKKL